MKTFHEISSDEELSVFLIKHSRKTCVQQAISHLGSRGFTSQNEMSPFHRNNHRAQLAVSETALGADEILPFWYSVFLLQASAFHLLL